MKTIGAFAAKTNLSALLDAVAAGETICITKRGKVVAHLTPPFAIAGQEGDPLLVALEQFRATARPGRESMSALVKHGRKR